VEKPDLRQILGVSWTARKTNEWILEKAGVTRTLLASIKTTKRYFGHASFTFTFYIMRHNSIERISSKEPYQERGKVEDQRQHG